MSIELGTRAKQNFSQTHPPSSQVNGHLARDPGMSKRSLPASATFVNSATNQIQGAANDFVGWIVGERCVIRGTQLNNGEHQVLAIDATNHAYLQLDQGVKNEGPIAGVEVRTP
ncbi:MAG TPA: hypothetical protein VNT30_09340 [Stellaceae bacterium]|nr:hypothetical protein [Stellaceae bacterium]